MLNESEREALSRKTKGELEEIRDFCKAGLARGDVDMSLYASWLEEINFRLTDHSRDAGICWDILPEVSRSFALCIKMLPSPTDERMMISYLILRIVDTVEDSGAPVEVKKKVFADFIALLAGERPSPGDVFSCRDELLKRIDHTYERVLLENLGAVVSLFHSFTADERSAILDCTEEMILGMLKFQGSGISDFASQEEYCYYVAGIVGHLDTRLFQLGGHIGEPLRKELMEYAGKFGIALQKVNVLRDVAYDIPEGRYFWPASVLERHGLDYGDLCDEKNRPRAMKVLREMVENALPYLEAAIQYVMRLPRTAVRIRVFCLIPLFMAIKSYAKCVDNEDVFVRGRKVKIDKGEVREITRMSFLLAVSNWALRRWYESSLSTVKGRLGASAQGGG